MSLSEEDRTRDTGTFRPIISQCRQLTYVCVASSMVSLVVVREAAERYDHVGGAAGEAGLGRSDTQLEQKSAC